jgi:methionyl-tRNA formyltransferase
MRVVFVGSVEFSESLLRHILELDVSVVGVCTLKDSLFNSDHCDLGPLALQHGIPVLYISDINSSETNNWIKDRQPDIIFCFGWSKLIASNLLVSTPLGVLGFHPTMLPKNRGRHPIVWALVLGLQRTGSTFFFMNEHADAGDIVSQSVVEIDYLDDARTLYDKLLCAAKDQLTDLIPRLVNGDFRRLKQDDSQSNLWRKRSFNDGLIDWSLPAESIRNLVRGLTRPYVGAHFLFRDQSIKLWKCEVIDSSDDEAVPGQILEPLSGMTSIKTGLNSIVIVDSTPDFNPPIGIVL